MPRLYLIRHGEPAAAWGGGDPDPGLSPLGLAQAADAAMKLAALKPRRILTSPMRRCVETAAALEMEMGLSAQVDPVFTEVRAPADVKDRQAWLKATFAGITQEDEARTYWKDAAAELRAWREGLVARLAAMKEDCAVFTHFIALNAIVSALDAREEMIVFRPAHASITVLDGSGGVLRSAALGASSSAVTVL